MYTHTVPDFLTHALLLHFTFMLTSDMMQFFVLKKQHNEAHHCNVPYVLAYGVIWDVVTCDPRT